MGPAERLKLLFSEHEALLQVNTGLRTIPEASPKTSQLPQCPQLPPTQSNLSDSHYRQLAIQEKNDSLAPNIEQIAPEPHDGLFCPLMAFSRFPYRYIQGDMMQRVASRFFDKGQFWDRPWDLYYIHVPPHLGPRHLLLIPAIQARKLLSEVNNALDSSLALPVDEARGLLLNFRQDGFPQPTFLGRCNSRSIKEQLDAEVPQALSEKNCPVGMDEQYIAFEKMMEAAYAAGKNKNKYKHRASKAKKQRLQAQRKFKLAEELKRVQNYLGLSSSESLSEQPEGLDRNCDQEQQPDPQLRQLNVDQAAPYPFWKEVVFISIDVEANELCHKQITEVGISTLDTRELVGLAPGAQGGNWRSHIQSRHLRVKEYSHITNQQFIAGCPDKFQFGTSEWVLASELGSVVRSSFSQPSFFDGHEACLRPLVLVGHGLIADIQYLENLGVKVMGEVKTEGTVFVDHIDTAAMFRLMRGEMETRSLGGMLGELDITAWYLHNAGNDARYTMEAMVAMLVTQGLKG